MKFLFALSISFILILGISCAQVVDISIAEVIEIEIKDIDYSSTITDGKPFNVKVELYNSGSIGYKARIRLDIFDHDDLVFTGWGDEKHFVPGNQKIYDLYWYPSDLEGEFKTSIWVYYANEIKKIKPIKFQVKPTEETPGDILRILNFRTYDEEIEFLLKGNKSLENIIIVPSNYPTGWIFEQTKIDKLESGSIEIVNLKYEPSLWKSSDVTINVFTEDGKYYTSKSFSLERETNFWMNFYKMINTLRTLINF
jgi:hypothetical protein